MTGLDVIVRLHDVRRAPELERCLLSLIGQSYRPLSVQLCLQRFDEAALGQLRALLGRLKRLEPNAAFHLLNHTDPEPADARSALINMGFRHATGRYAAILDYDDVIKPNAYARLIEDLSTSGAAISFGKVWAKLLTKDNDILMATDWFDKFHGDGLRALLIDNFCPIHSFVIDRSKIDDADLCFDPSLTRLEDYDFLIRFCAKYPSSFKLSQYIVGDYLMKDDGSNTILVEASTSEENRAAWRDSNERLAALRRTTRVSLRVQRDLGLDAVDPELTVARLIV